jgi:transcriptional regulator with XRE-family HTH domain
MKDELLNDIGSRIREQRKRAGWLQGDVAKAFNCGQTRVSGIENGDRDPGVDFLVWFAKRTGVSTDYFLLGEKTPQREIAEDFDEYVCDHVFRSMKHIAKSKSFTEKIAHIIKTEMPLQGPDCYWLNGDEQQLIDLVRKSPETFKQVYEMATNKKQAETLKG